MFLLSTGLFLPNIPEQEVYTYPPSHPWYYYQGGIPLLPSQINPGPNYLRIYEELLRELPKNKKTRIVKATKMLKGYLEELKSDTEVYKILLKTDPDKYEVMPWDDNPRLCWCTAISFKFNHINYRKAHLDALTIILTELLNG